MYRLPLLLLKMAEPMSVRGSIFGLISLFVVSCLGLYAIIVLFSNNVEDKVDIKFPYDYASLMSLIHDLKLVRDDHWLSVLFMFSAAYLFKQTFAIPGSFILNILAGAIFGPWVGLPLVCTLTAVGATNAFLVSKMFGHSIVESYLLERIAPLKKMISGDGDSSEFLILLSLRLFPNTPNWLINIASPHLGIHTGKFFLSVFIGLLPYNFLCVQAGGILQFTSLSDVLDSRILACLGAVSVAIVILVIVTKRRTRVKANKNE